MFKIQAGETTIRESRDRRYEIDIALIYKTVFLQKIEFITYPNLITCI